MKKFHFISIILIIIACILEVTNIFLSNKISIESINAGKLAVQIKDFEQRNLLLKSELLQKTSYENIASKAAELGFEEPKQVLSLDRSPKVTIKK